MSSTSSTTKSGKGEAPSRRLSRVKSDGSRTDEGAASEHPEDDVQMALIEHVRDLRKRLLRALLGIVPAIAIAWTYRMELLEIIGRPYAQAMKSANLGEPNLNFANPVDPFMAYMKVSIVVGILFAAPWIFYQVWSFIAPGLYRKEKKLVIPFVIASTVCFCGGAFFGHLLVLPPAIGILLAFAGPLPSGMLRLQPTIMIDEYLSFATMLLLAFGVIFEVPVVITALAAARIVDWKQLLKFSRWWIVIAIVLGAVLSPGGEISTQLMIFFPLVGLYFLSIGIAFFFGTKKANAADDASG